MKGKQIEFITNNVVLVTAHGARRTKGTLIILSDVTEIEINDNEDGTSHVEYEEARRKKMLSMDSTDAFLLYNKWLQSVEDFQNWLEQDDEEELF